MSIRFSDRDKVLVVNKDARTFASQIQANIAPAQEQTLRATLTRHHPSDIANAMHFLSIEEEERVFSLLNTAEAAELLHEANMTSKSHLVRTAKPQRLASLLEELPADEGADIISHLPPAEADEVLALLPAHPAAELRTLLSYKPDTAGGIMSLGYVSVPDATTQAQAVARFCEQTDAEQIFFVFVTDTTGSLLGAVDLRRLISAPPSSLVRDLMVPNVVAVTPDTDQEQVANIFARYDLTALPVINATAEGRLVGVITADDIINVIREEASEDIAGLTGSDAAELEKKSPWQIAKLRMPWIMATMLIELLAGFVIRVFNPTLDKYLLLASFMPIISAISGNTGLQSAAIIIRGLSSGQVKLEHWKHALARQAETTAILGAACAVVLGIIGGVWDGHVVFGLVVLLGMFMAVNIAGIVGTGIPLLSKRAGFDPALTSGPFETAFQDVIGISIFLGLATVLLAWLQ